MVGVDMGFDRIFEPEAELANNAEVALNRLDHRVDQRRFAALFAADEIGVGRRLRLEQLAEQHRSGAPLALGGPSSPSASP
jgi:hypothetical protein